MAQQSLQADQQHYGNNEQAESYQRTYATMSTSGGISIVPSSMASSAATMQPHSSPASSSQVTNTAPHSAYHQSVAESNNQTTSVSVIAGDHNTTTTNSATIVPNNKGQQTVVIVQQQQQQQQEGQLQNSSQSNSNFQQQNSVITTQQINDDGKFWRSFSLISTTYLLFLTPGSPKPPPVSSNVRSLSSSNSISQAYSLQPNNSQADCKQLQQQFLLSEATKNVSVAARLPVGANVSPITGAGNGDTLPSAHVLVQPQMFASKSSVLTSTSMSSQQQQLQLQPLHVATTSPALATRTVLLPAASSNALFNNQTQAHVTHQILQQQQQQSTTTIGQQSIAIKNFVGGNSIGMCAWYYFNSITNICDFVFL